jgi:SAM-dependent methyltransferase
MATSTHGTHNGPVIDRVADFDVIECAPCGFRHVLPLPSVEELAELYHEDYYAREKPLYLERTEEDLPWWTFAYRDRYAAFEASLTNDRRRLLEVGSGPGYFLQIGRQRGWDTTGIEPSTQAAAHTRDMGLTVVEDFLTPETAATLGTFDVVHMYNVLEHVPDPTEIINLARDVLAPDGLISICVPNDYNILQDTLRKTAGFEPWWLAPPHHLNYFGFSSMADLLERQGFDVIARTTSFPMEVFLFMGQNYVGNDEIGRRCHAKRKMFDTRLEAAGLSDVRRDLYKGLAELGIGREVLLIARRRPSS